MMNAHYYSAAATITTTTTTSTFSHLPSTTITTQH
jgi:hypothetical protein